MFRRDDVVSAIVEQIEEYGVYLSCENERILVLIVDISLSPVRDIKKIYAIGQKVRVRILEHIHQKSIYKGSFLI